MINWLYFVNLFNQNTKTMKNYTKIFLIFTFLVILDFTFSCCPKTVDRGIFHYTHCKIDVFNIDNSGKEPHVILTGNIPKKAYGISLYIEREIDSCPQVSYQSFLFSSTYAFVPGCYPDDVSTYLPMDKITSIKIFTRYDFDSSHPENSEVSDKFYIFEDNKFYKIEDYLTQKDFTIEGKTNLYDKLILLLMDPPELNSEHEFLIKVYLNDNRILAASTPPVNLI